MKRNTFPLKEHLKSTSIIDSLYANGESATAFPLRAVFLEQPATQEPTAAILVNVAKRRFRHAVDRNLLKRRMREAYRTGKHGFIETLESNGKKMAVAIMYIDNKPSSTEYLKRRMEKLLNAILSKAGMVCEK